jgi:hypothetical protein
MEVRQIGSRIYSYARLLRTLGMILWPVIQSRIYEYVTVDVA